MMNSIQQISMKFPKFNKSFIVTSVYARCTALERLELWEELESLVVSNSPWIVKGDFNVILNKDEKMGGLEFTQQEAVDFAQCINICGLSEIKFSSGNYT